jgi:FlaA1/EpsC-like NDP-sugar epimerase
MGDPVKIIDLAMNLIKLSGNSVEDIGIEFTGMRPGEKLFEELMKANEIDEKQVYPKIYIGKTADLYMEEIIEMISIYSTLDKAKLRERLLNIANNNVIPISKKLISIG